MQLAQENEHSEKTSATMSSGMVFRSTGVMSSHQRTLAEYAAYCDTSRLLDSTPSNSFIQSDATRVDPSLVDAVPRDGDGIVVSSLSGFDIDSGVDGGSSSSSSSTSTSRHLIDLLSDAVDATLATSTNATSNGSAEAQAQADHGQCVLSFPPSSATRAHQLLSASAKLSHQQLLELLLSNFNDLATLQQQTIFMANKAHAHADADADAVADADASGPRYLAGRPFSIPLPPIELDASIRRQEYQRSMMAMMHGDGDGDGNGESESQSLTAGSGSGSAATLSHSPTMSTQTSTLSNK